MAIEIKRTPVLEGSAAQAFLTAVQQPVTKASEQKVASAIDRAKKILSGQKTTK